MNAIFKQAVVPNHKIVSVCYYPETNSMRKIPVVVIMFYVYDNNDIVEIEYFVHSRYGDIENGECNPYHIGYEHEFDEPYDWKEQIENMKNKHGKTKMIKPLCAIPQEDECEI